MPGEKYFISTQKASYSSKGENEECEREKAQFSLSYSMHPHKHSVTSIPLRFSFLTISSADLPFSIVPAEPVSCHAQQFSSSNREVSLFLPFFTFSLLCLGPQVRGILTPFKKLVIGIGSKGYPVDHKGKKV